MMWGVAARTALSAALACMQSVLDEMGADWDCTTLNPQGDLVVARPEAVYFYSVDGRGPCFVFEGALLCLSLRCAPVHCMAVVRPRDARAAPPQRTSQL